MNQRQRKNQLWPSIMLVVAAAGWGLFWIPLREFEAAGLAAGWVSVGQFLAPTLVLAPVALIFALRGRAIGVGRWKTALFTGGAFALYADSLLLTEVARALILFYLTPAWSTAFEVWLMKRRLTPARSAAIVLGLAGLCVILGGEGFPPLPRNAGDWMALASGLFWAYGSMRVRMAGEASVFENVFSFFGFGAVVALALAMLPIEALGTLPSGAETVRFVPWLLLVALAFLIPVMFILLYGAQLVDPGRVGILLQAEVIVGIASAAILTSEPFGWREAAGSALVIGAALTEVLVNRPSRGKSQPTGSIAAPRGAPRDGGDHERKARRDRIRW